MLNGNSNGGRKPKVFDFSVLKKGVAKNYF